MRSESSFSVSFVIRRRKREKSTALLYARINVDGGQPVEASLNQTINAADWDCKKETVKGTTPLAKMINKYIDEERFKIVERYKQLISSGLPVTPQKVKDAYQGNLDKVQKHHTLLELFKYHNKINTGVLSPGTMKNYGATRAYIINFINVSFNREDFYLAELNYEFLTNFEYHIRNYPIKQNDPCKGNGVAKHIERLKGMVKWSKRLQWISRNPFEDFQVKKTKPKPPKLHIDELMAIEAKRFHDPTLSYVKDLFLFSCYTGLAYADVSKFSKTDFYVSNDGRRWLTTYRQKSDEFSPVPLLDTASKLIDKYRKDPRSIAAGVVFPPISNQEVNRCLKIIRATCEIAKDFTFHTARHTFGTTVTLKNKVPVTSVQKMMGHTKLSTTQGYIEVDEEMLGEDMEAAQEKFEMRKLARMADSKT